MVPFAAFGVEAFEEAGEVGLVLTGVTLPLLQGEVGEVGEPVGLVFGEDRVPARGFPLFFVAFLAPPSEKRGLEVRGVVVAVESRPCI